jgi:phosphate:Na+ symporter
MDLLGNILKLLAGVGLFLFAMYLLEKSLQNLSGRSFKRLLQRMTRTHAGGALGGAVVTGILQSSSMVTMMVIAFVGAGVFTLKNAMAIILGANLGTQVTGWLVATLGFKIDIALIAYPIIVVGGIVLLVFKQRTASKYVAYFLFGFGLLFVGLSLMKTAMEGQVQDLDFSGLEGMPLLVFLLAGFVITVLVQSSSVTMALAMSALNVDAIAFAPSVAMVIGSELGTNVKLIISGIGGNAAKKRVILGTLLFNFVLTVLAIGFLHPLLRLITDIFQIKDPLIGLILFSTLVNFCTILLFLPFLNLLVRLLDRFFKDADGAATAFIGQANPREPQGAIELFRREAEYFLHNCMLFVQAHFEVDVHTQDAGSPYHQINHKKRFIAKDQDARYDFLKQMQGEIQAFYVSMRSRLDEENLAISHNQLISAVRSAMYAAKCIRDISNNISNLQRSSKDVKYQFYQHHKQETGEFYQALNALFTQANDMDMDALQKIYMDIEHKYTTALDRFYESAEDATLDNMDLTTMLNFNRELFTSNKAMFMAVKDLLLDEKQAERFNEMPLYRT